MSPITMSPITTMKMSDVAMQLFLAAVVKLYVGPWRADLTTMAYSVLRESDSLGPGRHWLAR